MHLTLRRLGLSQRELARQSGLNGARQLEAARAAQQGYKDAIAAARAELAQLRDAGKAGMTPELAAQTQAAAEQLKVLQGEARKSGEQIKLLGGEQKTSAQASREAAAAQQQAGAAYDRSVKAAGQISAALGEQRRALDGTRDALRGAGLDSDKLAQAQANVNARAAEAREKFGGLQKLYRDVGGAAGESAKVQVRSHRAIVDGVRSVSSELALVRSAYVGLQSALAAVGAARGIAATADQVSNLQARVKLATGDGELFAKAWAGVVKTAQETNSALSATGDLFARVAVVGKEAGLSGQAAIEQSMAITRAVNQAAQLSGASAEASNAAITQLIQGLQSGVLRGDEFNSVMEQAPRLAKALADGLGVTTGQLRAMAEQGQLTSKAVIASLKSQAEALNKEFGTLPQTIGRSVENLNTAWSLFVNQTDRAHGASAQVAQTIDLLARNIDTLAAVALRAGEVVVALFAVKAIKAAYDFGAAVMAASRGMDAVAASSGKAAGAIDAAASAKARFGNIARGIGYAEIADQVLQIALAYKELKKEQDKQAAAQSDLDANAKKAAARYAEISAATGVLVRNMGELDAAVASGALVFEQASGKWMSAAQAQQALAEAAARSDAELAKVSAAKAVAEFEKLNTAADKTKDALEKLVASLKVGDPASVAGFTLALDELRAKGTLTAQQVSDAWQQALGKLSAGQVGALVAHMEEAARRGIVSAKQLANVYDQVLTDAFRRVGVNAAQAMGRVSDGAQEAANTVELVADAVKKSGASAAQAARSIEMAFAAAIPKADSLEAIDKLREKLAGMRDAGQLGADAFARLNEQLAKQRATIEGQIPGIQSLGEALRELGVKPQAELAALADSAKRAFDAVRASGTATPREINEAWRAMAEAAIAANNGVAAESVKSQAAQHGFAIETDKAGKSIVKSMAEAEDATRKVGDQAKEAGDKMAGMSAQAWEAGKDLVEQARRHNAALGAIQSSWLDAAAAASKYAEEAARLVFDSRKNIQAMRQEHAALVEQLEVLGRQQRLLEDANGGAARGVEDLRLRLLELEGTEQQVAAARNERDKADLRSKMALARIELERATLANKQDEAQRLEREIALLGEQLALLGKVYAAEQKQRAAKARGDEGGRGGGGGGGGGVSAAPVAITLNANGISDPVKLARMIEPELARLGRLAR